MAERGRIHRGRTQTRRDSACRHVERGGCGADGCGGRSENACRRERTPLPRHPRLRALRRGRHRRKRHRRPAPHGRVSAYARACGHPLAKTRAGIRPAVGARPRQAQKSRKERDGDLALSRRKKRGLSAAPIRSRAEKNIFEHSKTRRLRRVLTL